MQLASIVAGVRPGSPGFATVEVRPALGDLDDLRVEVPHPAGVIEARYRRHADGAVEARVTLPGTTGGTLHWRGEAHRLRGGTNVVTLPAGD